MNIDIKKVFVLGANSEIAQCICLNLASKGCKEFLLMTRNVIKTENFASKLENKYKCSITIKSLDLFEDSLIREDDKDDIEDYDLYLIAAGSLGEPLLARNNYNYALKIIASNFTGHIKWLTKIVTNERIKKNSRLWVLSSVAADRGRPSNYHYGSSKSGLNLFCEGLLLRCHNKPFSIRLLKLGFVSTNMSIGKGPKILFSDPEWIAKEIIRKHNKRGIEYLPGWWKFIMIAVRLMPNAIISRL